jgi:hypothetical protein
LNGRSFIQTELAFRMRPVTGETEPGMPMPTVAFAAPASRLVPPEWLAAIPGRTIVAAHTDLIGRGEALPPAHDIAAAFGWSIPTVKNEIHRARLKLRAHLLPHLTGERP